MSITKSIVSVEWLWENLDTSNLVVLDASLPKPKAKAEDNPYAKLRIPGARFFDIDHKFSDTTSDLPHMMPSADHFDREACRLGISNRSKIVIYDNLGIYSSPRAWWMFKAMGHKDVCVLDGGLPEWINKNMPTEEKEEASFEVGDFRAEPISSYFTTSDEVLDSIDDFDTVVLDARSSGRFAGSEPEPRAGLRSGHIPNSKSLPFTEVIDENRLLADSELKKLFTELGAYDKQLVFSCGSGLTACILALAANVAGIEKLTIYDGSWSEWGQPNQLPVSTGD